MKNDFVRRDEVIDLMYYHAGFPCEEVVEEIEKLPCAKAVEQTAASAESAEAEANDGSWLERVGRLLVEIDELLDEGRAAQRRMLESIGKHDD